MAQLIVTAIGDEWRSLTVNNRFPFPSVDVIVYDTLDPANGLYLVKDFIPEVITEFDAAVGTSDISMKDELGANIAVGELAAKIASDEGGEHTHEWDETTGLASSIPFNTNLTKPAYQEGLFYYDKDEHAIVSYNDESDVTQQVGREFYRRVRNDSGVTITNGMVVYQSGAEAGGEGRALIDLAQADSPTTENVIGVATHDIENNSYGYITVLGDVNDVNTAGYTAGSILFLSPTVAGTLTDVRPDTDEFVVEVVTVEKVDVVTGRYNVNIKNRGRLTDFDSIGGLNYWQIGLDVTESDPKDQTVDYTSGSYIINGVQYSVATGGTIDMQSPTDYYATMTNDQHRIVLLYADTNGNIGTVAGAIAGKNDIPDVPSLPADTICVSLVEIRVDGGGTPRDIVEKYHMTDCRQGFTAPSNGHQVFVSPNDTTAGYLRDSLTDNGNVTFTIENVGADESMKADVDVANDAAVLANTSKVSFPEAPIDGTQYTRKDGSWEVVAASSGGIAQIVSNTIAQLITTATVPDDNTAPTITEGAEIFSITITPASASNKIELNFGFNHEVDTDTYSIGTLFRDNTAICVMNINAKKRGYLSYWNSTYLDSPATTSPVTYSFRAGTQFSKPAILYINVDPTGTFYAGLMEQSQIVAKEINV